MPLPPPDLPPSGTPPVLWTSSPDEHPSLESDGQGGVGAGAFTADVFRDVIIDAVLDLETGGADAAAGLFLRQVAERDYLAFTVTAGGRGIVFAVENGTPRVLAEGSIPADAPFVRGIPSANRLTVVAAGPSVTCIVNGFVLTGVIVPPAYKAGYAGAIVVPGQPGVAAAARVRWAQVRALLPDQQ